MRHILFVIVLLFSLPIVYAGCGDGSATGAEQCDGNDLRGYTCQNLCYMNPQTPSDYSYDASKHTESDRFYCYDAGTLRCANNCKVDFSLCYSHICGNAVVTGSEECDDGADNSDTQKDACRTDCTLPSCGDDVVDAGEQCDDGTRNSDAIPGACRSDCTHASCGDDVIDVTKGEECDDTSDRCFKCRRCREPVDDLEITTDTVLCSGHYQIVDEGAEGVIRVKNGVTLQCSETYLYGVPTNIAEQIAGAPAMQNGVIPGTQDSSSEQGSSGPFGGFVRYFKKLLGGNASPPSNAGVNLGVNAIAEIKHGTGILVLGDESLVVGCDVTNYRVGIEVRGDSALVRNHVCDNNRDVFGDGVGLANSCDGRTWDDTGFAGCAYACNGQIGDRNASDCSDLGDSAPGPTLTDERPDASPGTSDAAVITCDDGSKAKSQDDCKRPVFKCRDGSVVYTYKDCPVCSKGETMCDNGKCVDEAWLCDPYTCDDGTNVESKRDCPEYCAGYACDDGRCVKESWLCDPYACADGSLVENKEDCADTCAGYRCDDGACVKSESDCVVCCRSQTSTVTARMYRYTKMGVSACTGAKGVVVESKLCS